MRNKIDKSQFKLPSRSLIDKVTYDKIQRHLSDINDKISEEDIRNVKIDIAPGDKIPAGEEENRLLLKERANKESVEITPKEFEEGRKINSTWNILEE